MRIIFGASGGLGSFIFKDLSKYKRDCVGTYYNSGFNKNLKKLDITSSSKVKMFLDKFFRSEKNVTIINCSGLSINTYLHKSDEKLWIKTIETNLIGSYNIYKHSLSHMRKVGNGTIINLSSIVGQIAVQGTSAYSASKSALDGLTRTAACENASKDITINNIALGYFDRGLIDQVPKEARNNLLNSIPKKRFGHPSEIVQTILFMEKNRYLTGSTINLNGGLF